MRAAVIAILCVALLGAVLVIARLAQTKGLLEGELIHRRAESASARAEAEAMQKELADLQARLNEANRSLTEIKSRPPPAVEAPRESSAENAAASEALRAEMTKLKADLEAVNKDMAQVKRLAQSIASAYVPGMRPGGPDVERLKQIVLPDNATEEQARSYILEILAVSEGQSSYSPSDPQAAMLAKVGVDRLPLLIGALGQRGYGQQYLMTVIQKMVTDKHKKLVIDSMGAHRELWRIVTSRGWEQDAKDVILKALAERPQRNLDPDWIDFVARLQDPKTYDDLKAYFLMDGDKESVYRKIAMLPGIDLTDAVRQAWESTQGRGAKSYQTRHMAIIALEYGYLDALDMVMTWISENHPGDDRDAQQIRAQLLQRLPVRGTNQELVAWYNKNKNQLDFDPKTKKFVIFEKDKAK